MNDREDQSRAPDGRSPGELADLAEAEVVPNEEIGVPTPRAGRLAISTAFFSFATALSRIAGLVREIFAASYFGVSGAMSAFTIAFQVPNLVRSLFADAAIQAAFVPVFTEKLERGDRREAFRLATNLIYVVCLVLGALTALFILVAPLLMPVFVPASDGTVADLTVSLSRILFPILILLGASGMVVGILNSYDRFGAFAISPLFWNLTIIAVLVGLAPAFPEGDEIYAYAVGVLAGTVVQLAICLWDLKHTPYGLRRALLAPFQGRLREALRDVDVRRVLTLMLPVTISLGLINFNLLINSTAGFLVSERAPAAIDKAFRIYMLPQGVFSVAVATVLFPTLARFAARGDLDRLRSTTASRHAPDPAAADPGDGRDPGPRRADDPGRLRARRLRPGRDRPGLRGALLVRLLAPVQRHLPAPHADLLQPPAALGADGDRRRQPRDHRDRRLRPLRAVRGRRDRRRDRDRHRGQRRRAGGDPAPGARPARARPAALDHDPDRRRLGRPRRGQLRRLGAARRPARAGPGRADRLARDRPCRRRRRLRGGDHAAADPRGGADLGAAAAWRWRRRGRARGRRRARRGPARGGRGARGRRAAGGGRRRAARG